MEGLSSPQEPGAWRLRRWALPTTVVVGAFAVLFAVGLPTRVVGIVSGSSLVLAGLIIAVNFFDRARQSSGPRRWAWLCFGTAALLATLSNLSLLINGYRADRGSTGDLALVLGLIFGVVGIAAFPLARRRGTDLARMILDGVVFGGSILFILSLTLSPHLLDSGQVTAAGLVVPVADVVLATVAMLLMVRGAAPDRPILGLTALGFCCVAISDFSYAVTVGRTGTFNLGTITDLGWIAGYIVITMAVMAHDRSPVERQPQARELSPILGTSIMFGLFIAAAAVGLVNVHRSTLSTTSALVWFTVLIGVFARQILLVVDNERLRRIQERQVIDRGRSLRQMAQQSDLLVNSVDDGIYGVDREGVVTFVNPAATRILGVAPQDLVGLEAHATFHAPSATGIPNAPSDCYVNEAIRERTVTNSEADGYLRADGLRVPVEVTASPLIVDSETIGAVVVFRDITQRHEIDRLKTEFISMVSHELRTPLTAIRGSLGLIAGNALGDVSPVTRRMVDIALVSCERLTRLIDDILDLERMESGVIPLDLGTHGALDLVEAAVAQVQVIAHEAQVAHSRPRRRGSGPRRCRSSRSDSAQSDRKCDQVFAGRRCCGDQRRLSRCFRGIQGGRLRPRNS